MRKHAADHLIPRLPPLLLGHKRIAGVDMDQQVVRTGQAWLLRFPFDVKLHSPPVAVPSSLCSGNISKMGRQDARGKKLTVCDFGLLLCDQLLNLFVTHSCQE